MTVKQRILKIQIAILLGFTGLGFGWLFTPEIHADNYAKPIQENMNQSGIISATKILTPVNIIELGDSITYTILFSTNTDQDHIIVTDQVPIGLTILSSTVTGTLHLSGTLDTMVDQHNAITWTVDNILANEPVTLTFIAQVGQEVSHNTLFTNTANLSSTVTNATLTITAPVVRAVDRDRFVLHKSSLPTAGSNLSIGSDLTYMLRITNTREQTQNNIEILDALSPHLAFITATAAAGDIQYTAGEIGWVIDALSPGETTAATLTVKTKSTQTPHIITNSFGINDNDVGLLQQSNIITHQIVPTTELFLPLVVNNYPPPLPVLQNNGFEAGADGNWSEYSSNFGSDPGVLIYPGSKLPDPTTAHNNSAYAVWLGGAPNEVSDLSQSIFIPHGYASLKLSYWYWIGSNESDCNHDKGYIKVNDNIVYTHQLCGNTGGWRKNSVDMMNYQDQNITIHFRAELNDSLNSNFFIDDISFEK